MLALVIVAVALIELGAACWLLFAVRQRLQQMQLLPVDRTAGSSSVTVIVPARDEAATIERCITHLLRQTDPHPPFSIIVVDDHSTDETAAIVARIAASDDRIQLIHGAPLPAGWTGKAFACWQGAVQATGDWLCFVDADTIATPELLQCATTFAEATRVDCLSLYPQQLMESVWERAILPITMIAFLLTLNFDRIRSTATPDAAAIGQFVLINRRVYEHIDGHRAVRNVMLEDMALAKFCKQAGFRCDLRSGSHLISTRMYTGLRSIWEGVAKNAVDGAGGPAQAFSAGVATIVAISIALLTPVIAGIQAVSHPSLLTIVALCMAAVAFVTILAGYASIVRGFGMRARNSLLLPVGALLNGAILIDSAQRRATGRSVWKGRSYTFHDL